MEGEWDGLPAGLSARLAAAGRRLHRSGCVRARSGNLSVRNGDGFVITAAGARVGELSARDLVAVGADGTPHVPRRPSSETGMHALIYRDRPEISAIAHTHSPYATAWACVAEHLELPLEEASYYGMRRSVTVIPAVPGGTTRLAELTCGALREDAAVLLGGHGAVVVASDIETAADLAESLEHQAMVSWLLRRGPDVAACGPEPRIQ